MDVGWIAAGPEVYTTFAAYANSKLCNMLMTTEIVRREALLKKEGEEVVKIKMSIFRLQLAHNGLLIWF